MNTRTLTIVAVVAMVIQVLMSWLGMMAGFAFDDLRKTSVEEKDGQVIALVAWGALLISIAGLALRHRSPRTLLITTALGTLGAVVAIVLYVAWDVPAL